MYVILIRILLNCHFLCNLRYLTNLAAPETSKNNTLFFTKQVHEITKKEILSTMAILPPTEHIKKSTNERKNPNHNQPTVIMMRASFEELDISDTYIINCLAYT